MKKTKHIHRVAALLLTTLTLFSACGGENNAKTPGATPPIAEPSGIEISSNAPETVPDTATPEVPSDTPATDVPEPADPAELALEQYRAIVAQADTYGYDSYGDPTGYQYALVQMQAADVVPTLLLKQQTAEYLDYVRVFQYNPEDGTVREPSETLMEGVASVGGFRGSLAMQADGNGIQSLEISSGSGDTTITRVTLDGSELKYDVQWQGRMDMIPDDLGFTEITWYGVEDASALDNWPEPGNTAEPAAPSEPTGAGNAELPTDGNRIVFRGTINSYTYDEVISLQGEPDPNGEWANTSETFRLIVLDTPQIMNLRSGDGIGSYENEVDFINDTYAEGLEQYDGQQLIFSIDPDETWWPSDTSLPLGRPSTSDVHVLQ